MKQLLQHYESLGLIEKTDSPFRATTVLVEKKSVSSSTDITDHYRLCVDYHFLNKCINDFAWPAPSLEHCLDAAVGSQYLSSLDFNSGYHQIPCSDRAKEALAFSPGFGFPQFTRNVMPQGIKPASNCFQRTMEKTFVDLETCILPPFYDDVIVKGRSFPEHLNNVRQVLDCTRECGFTLNALKCRFFQVKFPYLGHVIENGNISLDPERIHSIIDFPAPTNVKALRRFIGMEQFCSHFIPHLNVELAPLYHLTRKNVPYDSTSEYQTSFDFVKEKLTTAPVLHSPSTSDSFILETDASDLGIGCCLKVSSGNGEEFIVQCKTA